MFETYHYTLFVLIFFSIKESSQILTILSGPTSSPLPHLLLGGLHLGI